MSGEISDVGKAVNTADGKVVNESAPANVTAVDAPAQAARAPVDVEEYYSGIKTLRRLGLKLLLWMIIVVALLTLAAALRQEYLEWPPSPFMAAIPKRDLPPYHQIQLSDFQWQVRLVDNTEAKTLTSTDDVVGRYTLETLSKGKPIAESQLGPTVTGMQFLSRVVIEVPSPKTTIENFKAGDVIDVIITSPPTPAQQSVATVTAFQNILVLNIRPIENPPVPGEDYLFILALPLEHQAEFAAKIAKKISLAVQKKELTN